MPQTATRQKTKKTPAYDVHPSVAMVQKWVAELPEKTGRTVQQWIDFVKKKGPATEKERRAWLKKEHSLGANTAWWIAERAASRSGTFDDDPKEYLRLARHYAEDMYAGAKAGLRPIHDRLIALGRALGDDVRVCPCQTIVPLYRNHVFAQIKPTTNTRIDFGLCLKNYKGGKVPKRLIDTGGAVKGDRITHRIPISSVDEIDAEVKRWAKIAYELDA